MKYCSSTKSSTNGPDFLMEHSGVDECSGLVHEESGIPLRCTEIVFYLTPNFLRGLGNKTRGLFLIVILLSSFAVTADADLWKKLQQEPNMVVVMRNAESSGNRDGTNMLAWDPSGKCIGESTLTTEGKIQAKQIGEAFSRRGIKPFVIASPMCRCRETAQIAFGKFVTDPELRQMPPGNGRALESFQAIANTMLAKHRGKSPIVFVNHRPNIDALTMELLGIGELLVGVVTEDGEIETLGSIRLQD